MLANNPNHQPPRISPTQHTTLVGPTACTRDGVGVVGGRDSPTCRPPRRGSSSMERRGARRWPAQQRQVVWGGTDWNRGRTTANGGGIWEGISWQTVQSRASGVRSALGPKVKPILRSSGRWGHRCSSDSFRFAPNRLRRGRW